MVNDPWLIVFDVDGTLVDSQAAIVAAMTTAFVGAGLTVPTRAAILGIVGLSLPRAMAVLALDHTDLHDALVEGYKSAYAAHRAQDGAAALSPLYDGIVAVLNELNAVPHFVLGIATGKSRRGLDALIADHGLSGLFLTQQVADDHPSKPHPAMLHTAMSEAGIDAARTIMIGDTSFDMEMARAAGCHSIAVAWGYHDAARLAGADVFVGQVADLAAAIKKIAGVSE